MSSKAKEKSVTIGKNTVRLTPWRRFFLILWTFIIVLITLRVFWGKGRLLFAALIVCPLIFGVLVGLRLMGAFERLLVSLGLASPPPPAAKKSSAEKAVLDFLRSRQTKNEFRPQDLEQWCDGRNLPFSRVLEHALNQGWVRFMGASLVITSKGEDAVRG